MPPTDRTGPSDKDPAAFRTIREVSEQLGVPQHVLRFWETRFPELKPLQRGGNRRYYRPADVAFAAALHKLLHKDGYTVKGVRKLITDNGAGNLVSIANGEAVPPRGRVAAAVPDVKPAAEPAEIRSAPSLSNPVSAASRAILDELLRLREGLASALAA